MMLALVATAYGADNARVKAESAVANILFDYDGAQEFASYVVRDDGFVDMTLARNIPDDLYSKLINELKSHPDIPGVLAGKTGRACSFPF